VLEIAEETSIEKMGVSGGSTGLFLECLAVLRRQRKIPH
jgi:hypothetical protein